MDFFFSVGLPAHLITSCFHTPIVFLWVQMFVHSKLRTQHQVSFLLMWASYSLAFNQRWEKKVGLIIVLNSSKEMSNYSSGFEFWGVGDLVGFVLFGFFVFPLNLLVTFELKYHSCGTLLWASSSFSFLRILTVFLLFENSDNCVWLDLAECCEQEICSLVLDVEQAILHKSRYFLMVIFTFINCEGTY